MGKRELLLLSTALFLVLFLAIAVYAAGESTGTNGNDSSNNSENETTCTNDDDCRENYECEDGLCVLDDEDEEENETGDEDDDSENECEWRCSQWSMCSNGTQTRTCENTQNCTEEDPKLERQCRMNLRDKVCCKSTETEFDEDDNETKIKTEYEWEDRSSCLETDEDEEGEVKEIVNISFCQDDIRERCEYNELKERVKCRLENRNRFENFSESDESCEGLRNKGLCVALYVKSQNCYNMEGENKDRCFRRVSEFREAQIAKEVGEAENKTEARERVRHYMVLVLYNLQERVEYAVEEGKLTAEEGASLIEKIVEIKQSILEGEDKATVRTKVQELKDMWREYRADE